MGSFSKLTFYSSGLPHYVDYLAPLYNGLPEDLRGEFFTRGPGIPRARFYGIEPTTTRFRGRNHELVVVAGQQDAARCHPARCILVNHGAGQTYTGTNHPSYSGGTGRENVVLHLCPSQRDAEVNSIFAQAEAVGPYRLDPWLNGERPHHPTSVYVSFHHDANLGVPEGQSAFSHYAEGLRFLAKHTSFIGHGHPRAQGYLSSFWRRIGVPFQPDFPTVLDHASVYVCDNSSSIYEAAACGIPVVVLDAPWYRHEIHHGGRFWDWADIGVRISSPDDLHGAIITAHDDPLHIRQCRQRIVQEVYGGLADGQALGRALDTLRRFCERYTDQGRST